MIQKHHVKTIVEQNDTKLGRAFDIVIQFMIVASIVVFSFETLPNLTFYQRDILQALEYIFVLIFTLEYILRIYVADKKTNYMFSFYGVIDLISILPAYLTMFGIGLNTVWIRVFRLFRLFRLLKLTRYNKSLHILKGCIVNAKEELILFFVFVLMMFYISAVGIYFFENEAQPEAFSSVFQCMWWSVATLTTVGYGDVYPVTMGGKIFTVMILMVGLAIVAVPSGIVTSSLIDIKTRENEKKRKKDKIVFDKILASVGIGGAKIDTVIKEQEIVVGDTITGRIYITGGNTAQDISGIKLALKTSVEVESGDSEFNSVHTIDQWEITDKFILQPKENISYDFEIKIHNETPITSLNCLSKSKVWLDTDLDIDFAIDSTDKDWLIIFPTKPIERFFVAMDRLGYLLHSSDTELGYLNGGNFKSHSGCYQEFEFRPKRMSNINEVEASFVIEHGKTNVLLEIDRKFRGDNYKSFSISDNDDVESIKQKLAMFV
jgi:voltage-gated potassium channel